MTDVIWKGDNIIYFFKTRSVDHSIYLKVDIHTNWMDTGVHVHLTVMYVVRTWRFWEKGGVDMVTIRDWRISKTCGMVMVDDDYTVKNTVKNKKNTILEEIRSWQNQRPSA